MPPSEDHVRFTSAIDYIDEDFRAVYRVSLGAGSHRSGIRHFVALADARAWLEDEARRHGAELIYED
jgi:hypothetical protein